MKDEIKEILSLLKSSSWCNEANQIEDYITNLQEENERLKVELENKLTPDELVSMLNQELVRQNKNYKSRNEKAIEYINTHYLNANEPELLNILQGEDKKC